jgi:DNA-binding beta-propeller fold protein YncE
MCVDAAGNLFLADQMSHVVLKYSPDEVLQMTLGTRDTPSDTGYSSEDPSVKMAAGPFNQPTGVAVSDSGEIFVSDGYANARVHKFDARGAFLKSWGSPGTTGDGNFNLPHGIGLDGRGRVVVCDRENHRIQVFDQDGEHLETWTGFRQPTAVAMGPDGNVYVSELQHRVTVVDPRGEILARWGGESSREPGHFVASHGIAVDSRGDVYVGEVLEGKRVQKFIRQ